MLRADHPRDIQRNAYKESTVTTGQPGLVVLNPDGTNIGGGGGSSGTQYLNGAASASPTGTLSLGWDGTNVWALNVNASGRLQVDVISAPAQSVTDTAPATQNITVVDSVSSTTTGANSQNIITGTPTVGSVATFTLSGQETAIVQVTGSWTGTLACEVSLDGGTTWYTRGVHQIGSTYTASSFTANFSGLSNVSGFNRYRIRATAAMTGTATVKIVTSLNTASTYLANNIKLADSTTSSIVATVKAASTASTATDTALVVAPSPNSVGVVKQVSTTGTLSNVVASATSVTLLSANTARIGATITNDSSSVVYIKFGATASTTSYTVVLAGAASAPFSYYEVPAGYTGRIDAIWASATGNARVTEIS